MPGLHSVRRSFLHKSSFRRFLGSDTNAKRFQPNEISYPLT